MLPRARQLALALAIGSLAPGSAHAASGPGPSASSEPTTRVAVLPTRFDGELPPQAKQDVGRSVVAGFGRGTFEIVSGERLPLTDAQKKKCEDEACFRAVAGRTNADYLAWSKVTVDDRDYEVSVKLIDDDGVVVASSTQPCNVCGVGEVNELITDMAAALRTKLDAIVLGRPRLTIASNPAGATITLDGKTIGHTPVVRVVKPGDHRARAVKEGFAPQEVQFTSVAGASETLSFELARMPKPPKSSPLRPWGYTTLAFGAAGIVAGVTLLAIDNRPFRSRCDGDDVDMQGDCRFRYDTLTGGAIALGLGVASLTTGAILVGIANRREKKRKQKKQRRARVRPTAVGLGVAF